VMDAFEGGVLDLPDFYFTGDDYRYRFEPEAKERFLDLLRERFNSGVRYEGSAFKWDTVIEQKTLELGRYLTNRSNRLNFSEPAPNLGSPDDQGLRELILSLSHWDAKRRGIGKATLHCLKKRARKLGPLRIYGPVLERLQG